MKKQQSGFTLIELVMVIVILGILAASFAPKFVDMSTDATDAAKLAAIGAVRSAYTSAVSANKGAATLQDVVDNMDGDDGISSGVAAGAGVLITIDGAQYTVQTYTDNACSSATTAGGDTVNCVSDTLYTGNL